MSDAESLRRSVKCLTYSDNGIHCVKCRVCKLQDIYDTVQLPLVISKRQRHFGLKSDNLNWQSFAFTVKRANTFKNINSLIYLFIYLLFYYSFIKFILILIFSACSKSLYCNELSSQFFITLGYLNLHFSFLLSCCPAS